MLLESEDEEVSSDEEGPTVKQSTAKFTFFGESEKISDKLVRKKKIAGKERSRVRKKCSGRAKGKKKVVTSQKNNVAKG